MIRYLNLYILFVLLSLLSCTLDFPPEDEVSDPDAITSITSAQRALASAYDSYNEYSYALDVVALSDDMEPTSLLARNPSLRNTYYWNEKALLPLATSIWNAHYATIAKVNVLLERLRNISSEENSNKDIKVIEAQASYLKALCYFQLLKFFSPPYSSDNEEYGLLLKDSFTETKQQQRVTMTESVKTIQNLLLEIELDDDQNIFWNVADAIKYLRAELELWKGNYQEALHYAYPLYEKYLTVLESENPANIWTNNDSNLRIFALDMSNVRSYYYSDLEYDKVLGDYLQINQSIVYDADDIRNNFYAIPFTINERNSALKIFLLGKYNRQNKNGEFAKYYIKFRAEGLVFICAEAYLKNGQKEKAIGVLNHFLKICKNKEVLSENDENKLLDVILREKQKEFIGEPERFFDLKRNNRMIKKVSSFSTIVIEKNDYRWTFPIPLSERKHNEKIKQNKGWEYISTVN